MEEENRKRMKKQLVSSGMFVYVKREVRDTPSPKTLLKSRKPGAHDTGLT